MKPSMIIGLVLLVGGAFALPYFVKGPDGLTLSERSDIEKVQAEREASTVSSEKTRQTYYKWQDANGTWHMGDQVPAGAKAIPVQIDTAANIIRSVDMAAVAAIDEKNAKAREQKKVTAQTVTPLTPFTDPAAITEVFDQAKEARDLLNNRNQQLESMMQN